MADDSLTYSSMLAILQDAAVGGMTASKFSALETLASLAAADVTIFATTGKQTV
ncbi:MAG: hypothetical protein ABR929_12800 [Roseiarcus sp.]|jgi:hypothetical protein